MHRQLKTFFLFLIVFHPLALSPHFVFAQRKEYSRIVSLLPSATQTIYALGGEGKLVGVTRYCIYPPEAQKKAIVGGLLDVNYEVLLTLKPDLVVIPTTEDEQQKLLTKMQLEYLTVETRTIQGIIEANNAIGAALGKEKEARELNEKLQSTIKEIKEKAKNSEKPNVLITFLRPVGEGTIREVYIAGNHSFFNDIINIIGGANVYQGPKLISSPIISPEGILNLNPDIIIEVMSSDLEMKYSEEELKNDWRMLSQLKAYQNNQIHILKQPYIGIPGPKLSETLWILAKLVHPEINWDK